jgi:hypothetical protein
VIAPHHFTISSPSTPSLFVHHVSSRSIAFASPRPFRLSIDYPFRLRSLLIALPTILFTAPIIRQQWRSAGYNISASDGMVNITGSCHKSYTAFRQRDDAGFW